MLAIIAPIRPKNCTYPNTYTSQHAQCLLLECMYWTAPRLLGLLKRSVRMDCDTGAIIAKAAPLSMRRTTNCHRCSEKARMVVMIAQLKVPNRMIGFRGRVSAQRDRDDTEDVQGLVQLETGGLACYATPDRSHQSS